jgi:hypothetical protein
VKVEKTHKDGYRKCHVVTIDGDVNNKNNEVSLYINAHNYVGHTGMTIEHLKLVHKTIGKFLKKHKEEENG